MLKRGEFLPPSRYEACFVGIVHDKEDIQATAGAAAEMFRELAQHG